MKDRRVGQVTLQVREREREAAPAGSEAHTAEGRASSSLAAALHTLLVSLGMPGKLRLNSIEN